MMRCYPIPEEGTSGKESVRIHLTSPTGTLTGGIFYAYMLSLNDGTGVNNMDVNPNINKSIYNLLGQQLHVPQPGISIVNGKKIAF